MTPRSLSKRNRWFCILTLFKFMREANDLQLLNVAEYAAKEMVKL